MFRYEEVGADVRPPWWRSVLFSVVAAFFTLSSVVFSPAGHAMQGENDGIALAISLIGMLLTVGLPVALWWRHRIPFGLTLVTAIASVIFPIGNTVPFIALAALIGRRRGPAVRLTIGVVALTSTWVVIADALAQPVGASLFKSVLSPVGTPPTQHLSVPPSAVAAVVVLGLGLTVGAGFLLRSRRDTATARHAVSDEREASHRLGDEVARRQERERIAREVHDALGHRLSLLNLHAGALEAHSGQDPRLAQSAQLVQASATAAMDDLRSLLAVLREPLGDEPGALPLSRLPEVVRESFGTGQQLNSSIFIADADRADPTLARAVYRIVQELLTNARKHAGGEPVFLTVEGSPASGIVIDARNRYAGGWMTGPAGASRGLAGITERAELLGGTMTYGLDEGGRTFRVHVELPWREPS